jgi:NAD(P)H-hydrate epimerase
MKLVSVPEMLAIERAADAAGHSYAAMMEHAGRGVADVIAGLELSRADRSALGLVGSGNNGGDTLVALAHLASSYGWRVTAVLVKPRSPDDPLIDRLVKAGGRVVGAGSTGADSLGGLLADHSVLLDGILGTGTKLPLRAEAAEILSVCQDQLSSMEDPPLIAAIDCPSGVDCQNGQAAPETLRADLTITMAAVKMGMVSMPALSLTGDLHVAGIGLPAGIEPWEAVQREVVDVPRVRSLIPDRPMDAHKGTFGTVLVVGGSRSYAGAPLLSGLAAYRIGAGLVTLAVPETLHAALAGQLPEATWLALPEEEGSISPSGTSLISKARGKIDSLALGPGLGLAETTLRFLQALLSDLSGSESVEGDGVVPNWVVDADGLKLLASLPGWPDLLPRPAVLTPHPGEMAVLSGLDKAMVQKNRLEVAERFAAEWGHVVVLKGAGTIVASPSGLTGVIPVATAALARAGTGDVLTGVIAGLLAQGVSPYEAAIAGVWIHAQAGLISAGWVGSEASVIASDVANAIPDVLGGF